MQVLLVEHVQNGRNIFALVCCLLIKHSTQKPVGLLHPVENPRRPFSHVTMDFIVALPRSTRGYDAIFSIIDRFSRVCRFIPCHTSLSALEAA